MALDYEVVDWQPEAVVQEEAALPEWSGRRTRLPIAYPMLRGGYDRDGRPTNPAIVGGYDANGQPELVEFLAEVDPVTRRWVGPEAEHVIWLKSQGMIAGTEEQAQRAAATAAVEFQRGAVSNGTEPAVRPELRQRTKQQVQREYERVLAGGRENLLRLEAQERRADREENANAIRELAAAVRESGQQGPKNALMDQLSKLAEANPELLEKVLAQVTGAPSSETADFAGAAGPGTHATARRRRAQQEDSAVSDEES